MFKSKIKLKIDCRFFRSFVAKHDLLAEKMTISNQITNIPILVQF